MMTGFSFIMMSLSGRNVWYEGQSREEVRILISCGVLVIVLVFFFSSRRRHTIFDCDWSSDVCSSDLDGGGVLVDGGEEQGLRHASVGGTVAYAYFPNKEALFFAAVDEDAAAVINEGLSTMVADHATAPE